MTNEFGEKLDSNGYAPSIMESTGCYHCGFCGDLVRHEVFHGITNREKSKALGCWVTLCQRCHTRLHQKDPSLDWDLKRHGQVRAMAHYGWSVEEFIERFGRNYV